MASQFFQFRPRLLNELKTYDADKFSRDVSAGLTVAVVALPLAMAFAIASGLKPEAGIFTAIIAGLLISLLGGSKVQIGGPAGAFIVIIYGILEKYGLANLLISTILAGIMLFAMGALRLGAVIRYIPVPIVIGFTNGIAVLIALSQLKDFFGLDIEKMPGDFFSQAATLIGHAHTANPIAIAIALVSLAILVLWPKMFTLQIFKVGETPTRAKRITLRILSIVPGTIIVLVLATLAVSLFGLPVETIGTRFGGVPRELPAFTLPQFNWSLVQQLFPPALTIALLGAIESLLCARVADNLIGDRHDPNQELMAQGVANIVTPFFGGMPATGTIARTVTNIRSGAASPISGIVHALALLLIILIAAPLAANVPLAALAAVLLFVAYNMGEWHEFARLRRFALTYRTSMLATFLLTVMVDVTVAVQIGLLLACVFFIYRISALTRIEPITESMLPSAPPEGVVAYSLFGSLFFGAVGKLEGLLDPNQAVPKAMVLELHQLINIDTTGLDSLELLHQSLIDHDGHMILCGLNAQPLSLMERSGFLTKLGADNVVSNLEQALERARHLTAGRYEA